MATWRIKRSSIKTATPFFFVVVRVFVFVGKILFLLGLVVKERDAIDVIIDIEL
jgi:hypothetical protein